MLVGALNIRTAIDAFGNGWYFLCGLDVMAAVWMASLIFKAV